MNHRPAGSLGGGGWETGPDPLPGAPYRGGNANAYKKDKVLADMYEMFLDSVEPEIISTVVDSCKFNHKKSMEMLLDMCGSKSTSQPTVSSEPSRKFPQNEKRPSTLLLESPISSFQDKKTPTSTISQASANPLRNERKQPPSLSSILSSGSRVQDPGKFYGGMPRNLVTRDSIRPPPLSPNFPTPREKKKNHDRFAHDKVGKIRWFIENGKRIMVLMRGCPGSGKSFLANGIIQFYNGNPQDFVFSTDDYFMRRGSYMFDPMSLTDAHHWNQTRVLGKAREGWSPIIIDNTNSQLWEMQPYANIAINNGYAIEILEPETPWFTKLDELSKRNRHGVPRDKIKAMLDRYESGITVDGLITSTGAKYIRMPPQVAENCLLVHLAPKNLNQVSINSINSSLAGGIQDKISESTSSPSAATADQNLRTYTPLANLSSRDEPVKSSKSKELCKTAGTILQDGFHLSSFTSIKNEDFVLHTDTLSKSNVLDGVTSPFSVHSPVESGNLKDSNSFSGFKSRIIPIQSKDCDVYDRSVKENSQIESYPSMNPLDNLPSSLGITTQEDKTLENGGNDFIYVESQTSEDTSQNCIDASGNMAVDSTSVHELVNVGIPSDQEEKLGALSSSEEGSANINCEPVEVKEDSEANCNESSANNFNLLADMVSDINKTTENLTSGLSLLSISDLPRNENSANAFSFSSFSDLLSDNSRKTTEWVGGPNWDKNDKESLENNAKQNLLPKPPRTFSMKNIQDYCDSVKEINAASVNDSSGWSICENNSVSWQPIDKIQEEAFKKEQSLSPLKIAVNSQRSRFSQREVLDKGTNTHHADFCILSNVSSNGPVEDVIVLDAHDRDINEGKIITQIKVPHKLMLHKGTLTENDFVCDLKAESKQEKIKELTSLFPNRSPASIKELLKQCNWDTTYVSNLLLDDTDETLDVADGTSCCSDSDGNETKDVDSDVEPSTQEHQKGNEICVGLEDATSNPISGDHSKVLSRQEELDQVKRHIEQSIDFSERCYSPHTLSIKQFRRGIKEGAIPKSSPPVHSEITSPSTEATDVLTEVTDLPNESNLPQNASSGSSDGDEPDETLEFILSEDFIRQLVDKFGWPHQVTDVHQVVKFPVSLARQIHDAIFSGNSDEEDDGDFAMKLQCEEDEKIARQLYEEMLRNSGQPKDSSPPQLREIMDMELAQAIYKADVDSLTQNSQETIANVLAKRLLEDNYSNVDKKILHDIFASCNNSFEDTVKTLQEALSADGQAPGFAQRPGPHQSNIHGKTCTRVENYNDNAQSHRETPQKKYQSIEESIGIENPWELSDPKAYYEQYREKADQFLKERDEMYRKASDAFKRKERSVAAYYSKLGDLNGKKYHHASAMAAATLAAAHTDLNSSETLDLHFYKVVEAVTVFDLFVDYHIRILPENGLQQRCLDIITGRGTHSTNGRPRIKPAIISRSRKRNLRCQHVPSNPGIIRVWVSSNSSLSHEIPD